MITSSQLGGRAHGIKYYSGALGRFRAWCVAGGCGLMLLATTSLSLGQPSEADSAAYDQAIAAAKAAIAHADYDTALTAATNAIRLRPDDTSAKALRAEAETGKRQQGAHAEGLRLGRQALEAGNYKRAEELLKLVVQGWPGDLTAKELLVKAQEAQKGAGGDYAAAITDAEGAIDAGDYERAISSAKAALVLRPGDPKAQDLLLRASVRKQESPGVTANQSAAKSGAPEAAPLVADASNEPPSSTSAAPTAASTVAPETGVTTPKTRNQEVAVSADYLLGKGHVTMPFGFALSQIPVYSGITPTVAKPDRSSDYVGATLSYGYKGWYLDLGYAHGNSSGNADVDLGPPKPLPSQFSIRDDWFQGYIRKVFGGGISHWYSYVRAGGSYVKAHLQDSTVIPALGLYDQTDNTKDYLGNLGGGVGYALSPWGRFRLSFQLEGEGFAGKRSQNSQENLPPAELGFQPTATIDNTLYGGIGRGTVRLQYGFGESRLLKAFLDVGMQAKFTEIEYSSTGNFHGGTFDELLWGPYVKLGLRYQF